MFAWPISSKGQSVFIDDTRGASIVELVGALAAGLIVLAATFHSLSFFQQEVLRYQWRVNQQQDFRLSMEVLEEELRLAGLGSLTSVDAQALEFIANVHGLVTNLTAAAAVGETSLAVENASGWPDHKWIRVCWNNHCELFTLARTGQRSTLTLMEPVREPIPKGASVTVANRLRYYSKADERGTLRLLRQIDGGASVLIGGIDGLRFSYWNDVGQTTTQPGLVRRIVVAISFPRNSVVAVREIGLRT